MFATLAAFSLKSTLILGAAAVVVMAMKKSSAAARHLVWTAAVAAVLSLPLLSVSLPRWDVALPEAPAFVFSATGSVAAPAAVPVVARSAEASPVVSAMVPGWRIAAAMVWLGGALWMLASMGVAYWRMARKRSAAGLYPEQRPGSVPLLEAEAGSMPMTFGVLHPVVFLPADAVAWSADRRRLVVDHELAHVSRADVFTQLLARTALALCWWNPLAWHAFRASMKERERAADDLVLNSGARASEYAGHLLELARTLRPLPVTASAAVAMARRSQLEARLGAILSSDIRRGAPAKGWAVAALLIAAPLAAFQAAQADVENVIRAAVSQGSFIVLDDAAKSALEARRFDDARKLLEASLELRKDAVDRGEGLFRLGALASRLNRAEEATGYYERAAEAWAGKPQAARALIKVGIGAIVAKKPDHAYDLFQQAMRLDPAQSAEALLWMAVVRRDEGNATEADAHLRGAMAVLGDKSPEAVTVGRVYTAFLRAQQRDAEAADLEFRITRLRQQTALPAARKSSNLNRIGGAVKAPSLLQKVEPKYSEEARAAKLTGTTVLFVEVHPDGKVHNAQVLQPLGLGLDDRAIEAVGQWRFQPGTKDGQPVPVAATIEVQWKLL